MMRVPPPIVNHFSKDHTVYFTMCEIPYSSIFSFNSREPEVVGASAADELCDILERKPTPPLLLSLPFFFFSFFLLSLPS